ncbi:MAG TPA: hypothetical protein VGB07_03995 [Blastocatellia bacterium]
MKKTLTLGALMFFAVLCWLPQMQDGAQAATVGTCAGGLSCVPGGGRRPAPLIGNVSRRNQLRRELALAASSKALAANEKSTETPARRLAAGGLSLAILLGGAWLLLIFCIKLPLTKPLMSSRRKRLALLAIVTALIVLPAWPSLNLTPQSGQALARATIGSATADAPEQFTAALQIGGTGTTQIGGADYDAAGNLYVAGGFTGTVTFNTSPATTLVSAQDFDVFVAKFDANGQCQWARQANGGAGQPAGLSLDGALSLAVDAAGNSYVGGGFVSSLAFKNAAGQTVATLTDNDADINFELFVAKYDVGGNLAWARGGMSGAPDDPEPAADLDASPNGIFDILVDANGGVFVAGGLTGTNFLGTTVAATTGQDAVLARLDPATGAPLWIARPQSVGDELVFGMSTDGAGNLYLAGIFLDDVTFPTSTPTELVNPDQFPDTFLAKYDANGQCLFARAMSDEDYIDGFHIAATSAGEVYVVGMFNGIATFDDVTIEDDSEMMSAFLVKFDANGVAEWGRVMSQAEADPDFAGAIAERIALDADGNPVVAGSFSDQILFGSENPATQQTVVSLGDIDQFVAKWDAAGNFQWVKQVSATGDVSQNETYNNAAPIEYIPYRLLRNRANGKLVLTGDFSGQATLDGFTLDAGANRHAYVAGLGGGLQFYPLPQPVRLLETRFGFSGCSMPGNALSANNTLTLPAQGACTGIPATAKAVSGNITVVPQGAGYLTLFPSSASQPTVANSNFASGEVTNNVFTVALGASDGAFKIFSSATTHLIVDVTGYYAPPGAGGLYFHPLPAPVRLVETRSGFSGCIAPGAPLAGTGNPNADPNLDFPVQGRSPVAAPCNAIPASAQVLVGNATSVLPGGGGYLTIYPSGGTRPTVASSNYAGGDVINGPFAVKLGADGKFKIYTFSTTHLVVDILGYYSEEATDANGAGLLFHPLPAPVRLLETRPDFPGFPLTGCTRTNTPIPGNLAMATHTQQAGNFCGLPASAQAVVGNVSVVNSTGAGFLTLFPGNLTSAPLVATSNYPVPATFGYNRHYFVGLSPADGTFKVLTQFTTDLILDASGYFAP